MMSTVLPLLVITFVIIVSCHLDGVSAQHMDSQNMTTENSNMVTPVQKAMMDAKKVGDMCMKNEQCTKHLGEHAECKMHKCLCKMGSDKSSDSMKCEMKNFGMQNIASMPCLLLIGLVRMMM